MSASAHAQTHYCVFDFILARVCVCVCVAAPVSGVAPLSYLLTPLCSRRPALFVLIPLHLQGGLH